MFSMREFMELVKGQETFFKSFNRVKESSLQPIIELLGGEFQERKGMDYRTFTRSEGLRIHQAVRGLTEAKQQKYRSAIGYLRAELPMGAIPFVNTGTGDERVENCALCTVAALLGVTTTKVASGQRQVEDFFEVMARRLNLPRGHVAQENHESAADQLNGIEYFLTTEGYRCDRLGSVNDLLPDDRLRARMSADAEGTQYIVFLEARGGFDAHYNYATIENGRPRFFDYQPNYAGGRGVQSASRPIWPEERASEDDERLCIAIRAIKWR